MREQRVQKLERRGGRRGAERSSGARSAEQLVLAGTNNLPLKPGPARMRRAPRHAGTWSPRRRRRGRPAPEGARPAPQPARPQGRLRPVAKKKHKALKRESALVKMGNPCLFHCAAKIMGEKSVHFARECCRGKLSHGMSPTAQDEGSASKAILQVNPLPYRARRAPAVDCLKDLTGGIECAAKILNEIPQKDIQCTKRASKAKREGNGQGRITGYNASVDTSTQDGLSGAEKPAQTKTSMGSDSPSGV
ncbi:uncharacterized protein LOC128817458 [Vidua macroura]|uniref:uncharacterized protein LOC128817458 n=1 Tax=Vidua macroura TaxID=187451 RepID=UPI0023A8D9D5|nr:uncharacterized protein LOC128817458 [Vidua macroura]